MRKIKKEGDFVIKTGDVKALLYVIKTQIFKDIYHERQHLFASKLSASPVLLRGIYHLAHFKVVAPVLALLFGWWKSPHFSHLAPYLPLTLEGQINDSSMLDRFTKTFSEVNMQRWKGHEVPRVAGHVQFSFSKAKKIYKILARIYRRQPLYVVLRVSEAIFFYIALRKYIETHRPALLLISSEGNPPGIAALAAGKRSQTPLIYVAHAPHVANPARMTCEAAAFWGPQSHKNFLDQGSQFQKTFFIGFATGHHPSQKSHDHICFCLSKNVRIEALKAAVEASEQVGFKNKVIVRPHPNSFLTRSQLQKELGSDVIISTSNVDEDVSRSQICIGGASSVHLESLVRGVPSAQLMGLDDANDMKIFSDTSLHLPYLNNTDDLKKYLTSQPKIENNAAIEYLNVTRKFEEFEEEFKNYLKSKIIELSFSDKSQ